MIYLTINKPEIKETPDKKIILKVKILKYIDSKIKNYGDKGNEYFTYEFLIKEYKKPCGETWDGIVCHFDANKDLHEIIKNFTPDNADATLEVRLLKSAGKEIPYWKLSKLDKSLQVSQSPKIEPEVPQETFNKEKVIERIKNVCSVDKQKVENKITEKETYYMSNLKVTMDMLRGVGDYIKEQHKGESNRVVREEMLSEWILKQASLDLESAKWVDRQPWQNIDMMTIGQLKRLARVTLGPVEQKKQIEQTENDKLMTRGRLAIIQNKDLEKEFHKDELEYVKENYESLRVKYTHSKDFAFLVKVLNLGKEEVKEEIKLPKIAESKKEEFGDLDSQLNDLEALDWSK